METLRKDAPLASRRRVDLGRASDTGVAPPTAILIIGSAPADAVLTVAAVRRAAAPDASLTLLVNETRSAMFAATIPDATIVGFSGDRVGLRNASAAALLPGLRRAQFDLVIIVTATTDARGYGPVAAYASRLCVPGDNIQHASVGDGTQVTTFTLADGRTRRLKAALMRWRTRIEIGLLAGLSGTVAWFFSDVGVSGWIGLALAHVVTLVSQRASWGEYTGDAGIHFQFAKRTGMGELFCYDPGRFSAGSSSPLWTLLLALLWRLGARQRLERAAKLLASLAAHAAILMIALTARAWLGPTGPWGLAPLLLSLLPQFHVWTCRAMETSLTVLAGTLVCFVTVSGADAHPLFAAGVFAMAFMVRFENAVLVTPVYLLALAHAGLVMLVTVVPVATVAVINWAHIGSPVASTAASRRRAARVALGSTWNVRRSEVWRDLVASRPAIATLAGLGIVTAMTQPTVSALALIAWLALAAAFFTVVVPMTYDERYLMPSIAPYVLLATMGANTLIDLPLQPLGAVLLAAVVVARLTTVARGLPQRRLSADRGHDHERLFRQTIAWGLDAELPAGGAVALIEVDLRWFMQRDDVRVIGIDAVLDGTVASSVASGRYDALLAERGVTHVLIEENLHLRPGWRDTDLFALVGATTATTVGALGALVPVREWTYQNWGDVPMRWALWRVERAADPAAGVAA